VDSACKALIESALKSRDPKSLKLARKLLKSPTIYKTDPAGYIKNVLGITLWSKQIEIANALVQHKRVLVESANGVGKTLLCAALALWFHDTHSPSQTIITAPSARQVSDVTFKEIRRLYRGTGMLPKQPRIHKSAEHFVYGFTSQDATSFQGIHGENIFIIFEECTGIDPEFWEAANGILVGGQNTYFLAVCNPTDSSSQAFLERESGRWHTISISAFDHPNIALEQRGEPPLIPGAVRFHQLRELIQEWCEPVTLSPEPTDFEFEGRWWRPGAVAEARLLGRYPSQGSYSIFSERDFDLSLVEREPAGEVEIGCDVARFGDDHTVIHVQRGGVSLYHESYNKRDTKYTAERLKELAHKYAGAQATKVPIRVDSTGIGGGLCDQKGSYNFVEINASQTSSDPEKYPNIRSELLFTLADHMKAGKCSLSSLPKHQYTEIRRQALGITYKLDAKGRRVAETKADIKKRIGRSPDDLDGISLAYLGRPTRFDLARVMDVLVATKPTKDQIDKELNQTTEDDMVREEYKTVHYLKTYGTYQARPVVNGIEIPLQEANGEAAPVQRLEHEPERRWRLQLGGRRPGYQHRLVGAAPQPQGQPPGHLAAEQT
jgi:hypothetical protein